ncbi:hypothetical protein [Planctomycetes bacterium TBK1r]|uniref:Uncharacterized protein n=1 Tax=Stieleria magnilauensis TaxID=2527963 RepID=A0ABX5XH56_9BACT|nr:hypothetical protein TBK1r_02280 [Planctomycetes bacterium TBK1r]
MRKIFILSLVITLVAVIASQARRSSAEPDSTNRPSDPSAILHASNDSTDDDNLIVHEWGTFTTFSGSDGVFLDFRPLAAEHSDLPAYVLDRGSFSPSRYFAKNRLRGRVRMETPVTYFYTDRIRTVNVRVDFPEGLLTEFYPPVQSMLPAIDQENIFGKGELIGKSSLDWGQVDLIPIRQLVPNLADSDKRQAIADDLVQRLLPHGVNEQHYAEARATDSALVHVRGKTGMHQPDSGHFEKFLFYRGVGKFQLPISAHYQDSSIVLANDADLPIRSAILIDVDGDEIKASQLARIDSAQRLSFDPVRPVSEQALAEMVHESLVAEGLYEKEAASMVKTWQHSWFTENGTRILYMVPTPITDELLPLHVTPAPQETLRVLVGRMEMMSPQAEQQMIEVVAQSVRDRSAHLADQKDRATKLPYTVPMAVRDFGRMAEPALVRVSKIAGDVKVRSEATLLAQQLQNESIR